MMTRREIVQTATREIRDSMRDNRIALAEVNFEIDNDNPNHFRRVRLSDKRHLLEARDSMLCRVFDAKVKETVARIGRDAA